ncbi:MAG: extracellular solute-binding protein, partial [Actinomycetota bacterium]|nr:extracellular solute-binding protein [Actinomycetota bacterium]
MGLASRFRDESGIKVRLIRADRGERLSMLRSGNPGFQLFAEDIVDLRPSVDENLVQAPIGVKLPASVYEKMVDVLRFRGELYFLPLRPNVRLMYADKDKLSDAGAVAPTTFAEFKTVARRLKDENHGEPAVTLSLSKADGGGPAAVTISELILGQRGDPRVLNSDASVRAFQFLRECWEEGLLRDESLFGKHDTEVGYLKDGVAALAQNWSFTSSELLKSSQLDRFEVRPGWQGPHANVIGGDALGIPRGVTGKEKKAAIRLAEYLMSEKAQRFLAKEISWPSIQPKINEDLGRDSESFRAMAAALEEGWYRPTDRYWA